MFNEFFFHIEGYLAYCKTKGLSVETIRSYEQSLRLFDLSKYVEYRDYVITNLLMDTGMRILERLFIKTEDIDLVKRVIFLPAQNTKGRKDRMVYFSNEMNLQDIDVSH